MINHSKSKRRGSKLKHEKAQGYTMSKGIAKQRIMARRKMSKLNAKR